MRRAVRRDRNEPGIVKVLRGVGAKVILLDKYDANVLYRGKVYMMDFKVPKEGRLTTSQRRMIAEGWPLHIVRSPEEALVVIGGRR